MFTRSTWCGVVWCAMLLLLLSSYFFPSSHFLLLKCYFYCLCILCPHVCRAWARPLWTTKCSRCVYCFNSALLFLLVFCFFMYMWVYCVNEEQQFQYVCGGLNFVHKKLWFAVVQLESELNQGAYGTLRVAFECKKKTILNKIKIIWNAEK